MLRRKGVQRLSSHKLRGGFLADVGQRLRGLIHPLHHAAPLRQDFAQVGVVDEGLGHAEELGIIDGAGGFRRCCREDQGGRDAVYCNAA